MMKRLSASQVYFWGVIAIIGLGMALRLLMYFQNRSLFIDEACLSSQIIERSYGGMFENMQYQYAPPFFAVIVKGATDIFGNNEYALRLIPLLAALLGLVFFYRLCRRFLEIEYCFLPLLLFSFGMPMLQYATEVKQYSSDVLVTILILLLSLKWRVDDFDFRKALLWAVAGGFVVWFSMPGVFVLFGVGIYYLFEIYKKRQWNKLIYLVGMISVWLVSFGIYYLTIIRKDIGLDNLEDYHARFFMPLLPTSMVEWQQLKDILLSLFQTAIGGTTVAIAFGVLTTGWALGHLSKRDFGKVLLFCLPMLAAMIASGLKLYSLIPRLTLFFIPVLLLLIGIGQFRLLERAPKLLKGFLLIPIFILLFNQKGYQYFYQRFEIEELREVLAYVQKNRKAEDTAFLYMQGTHAYFFYSEVHEEGERFRIPAMQVEVWGEGPSDISLPAEAGGRIWLIFSHAGDKEIMPYLEAFEEGFVVEERFERTGARAILLKK